MSLGMDDQPNRPSNLPPNMPPPPPPRHNMPPMPPMPPDMHNRGMRPPMWNAPHGNFPNQMPQRFRNPPPPPRFMSRPPPPGMISYQLKLIKMRSELANLNDCAVPFLSRAAANLCWYYYTMYILKCRIYIVQWFWVEGEWNAFLRLYILR